MRIQTMSVVVGSKACNAHCPFCISKITPEQGKLVPEANVNWRNFKIACELANRSGVTTVLLTGKGEPTLYPDLITSYLKALQPYDIPFKELQTNGILLEKGMIAMKVVERARCASPYVDVNALKYWYSLGLTTVCLSIVHPYGEYNRKIYQPDMEQGYMEVLNTVKMIQDAGLMVRISCMLLNNYVDSVDKLKNLIYFCKNYGVKQLTVRPIDAPPNLTHVLSEREKWVKDHTLDSETAKRMQEFISTYGTPILELAHGGIVYDVDGQNVCWATCITTNKSTENMRQIIFFPDGTVSYDWKYKGAVLLG